MKKRIIYSLLALLTMGTMAGCQSAGEDFEIKLKNSIPNCITGEEYNFGNNIIQETGIEYSLEAYYQNYYEMKEYKLETNGLKFTQEEPFDVSVVVVANKNGKTKKRTQLVQTSIACDPIDELLASNGFSGFSDTGLTKEIIRDEQYCKDGGKSALAVYYQGNNYYRWGATVLAPTNFRLLDYWQDKTWEDTILKFWVYNPTEYDFEFQLRIADEYTQLINTDWGNALNIVQFAKPGEWTEVLFPLRRLGVDHTLYINESGSRHDSLNVKIRWLGTPTEEPTPLYSYQLYIDGVDFVPASQYPDIDTKCYAPAELASDSLENMLLDTTKTAGWAAGDVKYDRDVVRTVENPKSKSSAWANFDGAIPKDNTVKYGIMFNVGSAVHDGKIEYAPNLTHGILKADFKFENITNTDIRLVSTDESWSVASKDYHTTDLGDGWRRLELDMAEEDAFIHITEPIRIGFSFLGVDESNKATAQVHLDNFFYDQNSGSDPKPELETVGDGLENLTIDAGWNGSNLHYDNNNVCKGEHDSRYSLKLDFNCASINLGYGVSLAPEFYKESDTSYQLPDPSKSTIEFDVRFSSDITNKTIYFNLVQETSWDRQSVDIKTDGITPNNNGWYHVTLDMSKDANLAKVTKLIRLCFYFPGVDSSNNTTANVWLDNIFITANA